MSGFGASLQVSRGQKSILSISSESEIADPSLASFGRAEIDLAKVEMPGLIEIENEYSPSQPLKSVRITVAMHMTVQTAALVETLKKLGADVRCCSCNIFSTQDHAAAALVNDGIAVVFAKKGETLQEYWEFVYKSLTWPESVGGGGPDIILDAGGDPTLLLHEGLKAEIHYNETGTLPDPGMAPDPEFQIVLELLAREIQRDPRHWQQAQKRIVGLTEETTTGVHRLYTKATRGELLAPAMNINDGIVKRLFDSVYGCRHSVLDAIYRATDILVAGKTVVVCGYGAVGKGVAQALRNAGAKVVVSEIDPICALQASMEGYRVKPLEDATGTPTKLVSKAHIFVTCSGNRAVITVEHMKVMRNNAIIGNIGRFDREIQMESLVELDYVRRETIKPQVDRWVFGDTQKGVIILAQGRLMNLGCATGHPSFCMSVLASTHVLCAMELVAHRYDSLYDKKVYLVPRLVDEKVARIHLSHVGADLCVLTDDQAEALELNKEGPYKDTGYGY
eukprot:CAMPEP_0196653242 /NCGR_PEP_ID=MMETSP1086-20130531/2850_1 /TAXON_ID=77921 /ORGANISM="Cyanoptyche  gloeocystis , Strain SAG4.97" /LENGTH=506 /DNA_ID=CAMNT_0041984333 /DNA_START=81 /DNA_END=1601 /DNA_ORIENTATION=+